jgi:hypothetical protein
MRLALLHIWRHRQPWEDSRDNILSCDGRTIQPLQLAPCFPPPKKKYCLELTADSYNNNNNNLLTWPMVTVRFTLFHAFVIASDVPVTVSPVHNRPSLQLRHVESWYWLGNFAMHEQKHNTS